MIKTTMTIEGMMCGMCEAHIKDVIRRAEPGARKLSASHSRGEASFVTEEAPDGERLRQAVAATGYVCTGLRSEFCEKKGWFGR